MLVAVEASERELEEEDEVAKEGEERDVLVAVEAGERELV